MRNRTFRQTLLYLGDAPPERRVAPGAVEPLLLWSTSQTTEPEIDFDPGTAASFRTHGGRTVRIRRPIMKAALQVLAEQQPRSLGFQALFEQAVERVPADRRPGDLEAMRRALAEDVLQCFSLGALDLRTWQPAFAPEASERPRMSPLAARQAAAGRRTVVNMFHRQVPVGPVARLLAPVLDGAHDRRALVEHAKSLVRDGDLPLRRGGAPVTDPDGAERTLEDMVEQALGNLARSALLVA
jgi:hypothetical protein